MKHFNLYFLMIAFIAVESASAAESYSGFLVYDQEMIGFFPCGGEMPIGLAQGNIDIREIYQSYKSYLREPLYFEFEADLVDSGRFVYGLSSEPVETYLKVITIQKIQRHSEITCEARVPREIEIEILYDNP